MNALFESIHTGTVTVTTYLIGIAAALLCGVIAALCTAYRSHVTKSFLISLVLLPMIVQTVITMVNGNVGTGVAVMGAFSLIRFRSVPGKAKDIAAIFLSMTAGLACAAGYVGIALLFSLLLGAVTVALAHLPMGEDRTMELIITVPESLQFAGAFDELFAQYTRKHRLVRTKTTNMGSLYKLTYQIRLKDPNDLQAFIDDLRCRNGNLEIQITEGAEGCEAL